MIKKEKKITKKELVKKVKNIYPYFTMIEKHKKSELENILSHKCINFSLANEKNSCYLDSILIALFHTKNKLLFDILLNSPIKNYNKILDDNANEINNELIRLYNIISNDNNNKEIKKTYCIDLRKLLDKYQNNYIKYVNKKFEKNNWISSQSEPNQFINFLNIIFNYNKNTKIKYQKYATNSNSKTIPPYSKLVNVSLIEEYLDFVDIISLDDLINNKEINIKNYYPIKKSDTIFDNNNLWKIGSKSYKRKIEKKIILSCDFLIIHINRLMMDEKLDTKIIPILKLKMRENSKSIYLRSIIIHHGNGGGGHYTCLYECKGIWYNYDDTRTNIIEIGDFDKLCNYNNGYYLKNCTDLIYI